MNVVRDLRQRVTGLDVKRFVASLKWPPSFAPQSVETRHPRSLQPFHSLAQIWLRCFDREVKMISHDHEGVQPPAEPLRRFGNAALKRFGRALPRKQVASIVSTVNHVIT